MYKHDPRFGRQDSQEEIIETAPQSSSLVTGTLIVMSGLSVMAALSTMIRAQSYPVVRCSGVLMFMNAPWPLVLVSTVVVLCLIFILNEMGAKKARVGSISGEGYATYIFLGLPLLFGLTQLGLLANGAADRSRPEIFSTVVIGKRVSRSSKGPPQWHLEVADWRHQGHMVQIAVPEQRYDQVTPGMTIRVVTKRGVLGYEWMVSHT